jgi:hypothetical protein
MYRFGKRVLLGLTLGFRDARSARSRAKRDKIVAPPVCGGGHDIRVAPDGGVGAKSQKIGRERQALPLLRAQGDGASLPQDRRRRARWYARPCRPFSPFAHTLGRERAADARTDIPPRRPYNDGASLPRQDRNATQGGASPRPCRPFSSRHSPWAGADGRTRAASGRFVASHRHPTGGCLPSQRWGYARERPAGPTLRPTFRPRGGGLVVKI